MLLEIVKNNTFLQNLVVNIMASLHPSIMHNLGKIEILKKAFWHCELEKIDGDYFEFGIYEGTSLLAAVKCNRKINPKSNRTFFGFDSFDEGFKYFDKKDVHPFFKEGDFKSSYSKVWKRLGKFKNVRLVRGYFEESIKDRDVKLICGSEKCAVVFIDCDLMGPAYTALNFIKPILQAGVVLILDDYYAYKGNPNLGTSGALATFLKENPNIKLRQYCNYGYGGSSFIVTEV